MVQSVPQSSGHQNTLFVLLPAPRARDAIVLLWLAMKGEKMIRLNQRLPHPNNSLCLTQQELMVTSIGCFISHSFPFPKSLVDSFLPPPCLLRLQFVSPAVNALCACIGPCLCA